MSWSLRKFAWLLKKSLNPVVSCFVIDMLLYSGGADVLFKNYVEGIKDVEGWLSLSTAFFSYELMRHQTASKTDGNAVEIGVHHGKYLISLGCGLTSGEKAIGFDLFENQNENIDFSGRGDRSIFERHVARFLDPSSVVAIQANSLQLSAEDITRYGAVRFFSIDGGHTEAITVNDLRIAERSLSPGGIVALDDILNPHWTGVISGLARYMAEGGTLRAMALVPNKLFLCASNDVVTYRTYMRVAFAKFCEKLDIEMIGGVVDCFGDYPHRIEL